MIELTEGQKAFYADMLPILTGFKVKEAKLYARMATDDAFQYINETDPERRYICLQLAFFYFRESNQIKPWTRRAKTDFIRLIRSRSIISANVS